MAGKRQASTPRKSYWDGRWALERLTAGKRQASTPRSYFGMGLGAFACGVGGTKRGLERLRWALVPLPAGFWRVLEVKTGQINQQSVCGNRFYVKDSIRRHAHTCPVCATVVWSPHSSGRIACKHDTPLGQRCRTNQWYVPDQDAKRHKKRK